jgi:alpha-galactosidase
MGVGLLALGQACGAQAGKSPVKVFILAGQSNMEGQGIVAANPNSKNGGKGTLEYLVKDPESAPSYKHLVDKDGKWVARDDVWIRYGNRKGKLTVGYGPKGCIGPELQFGHVVGDYFENQVLLIKVAAGGTTLAGDFRPPSSGGQVGGWYKNVVNTAKEVLADLKTHFPDYDGQGCEIVGFGWHQGWQDGCAEAMANEYERNLANFIRDVRKDLGVPKMPFVIGGSGFGGWDQKNGRRLKIMQAQAAVAQSEEFKDNVRYVETRGSYRAEDVSPHRFRYHWNGNAETYFLIGDGMGKAIVELLGGPKAPPNPTGPSDKK